MQQLIRRYTYDLLLLVTFVIIALFINYCYPMAEFSWDGNYYVEFSKTLVPGIRPLGYSFFLSVLYHISPSIKFVVFCQYLLYFIATWLFTKSLQRILAFSDRMFFLAGVLLLIEPAALYNCFNILSDLLFSCLTVLYVTTLLLFVNERKWIYLVFHAILLFLCLETRHIALFYPFFSVLILIFFSRNIWKQVLGCALLFIVFLGDHKYNVSRNVKFYNTPVHSAFAGWTHANNAMFALYRIHTDAKFIEDPEISRLHSFISHYLDTTTFVIHEVASDWLWEPRSPLNILRQKVEDSLRATDPAHLSFYQTMYCLAPLYAKYGSYIETHYPYEYCMGFIIPNFHSLLQPHDGEMADYYAGPKLEAFVLQRYHLQPEMIYCRKQIFKNGLNQINLRYYQLRLALFAVSLFLLVRYRRRLLTGERNVLAILGCFVVLFFLMMLYSSRIMPRYILPVLPMITATVFILSKRFLSLNREHAGRGASSVNER